jgi:GNAT superfamily N-acetyltransferase
VTTIDLQAIRVQTPPSIIATLGRPTRDATIDVRGVADEPDWRGARALIMDYLEWAAAAVGVDPLAVQPSLRDELADLPSIYTPPRGALLLAQLDGLAVGVVGVCAHGDGWGELKRLYVRPAGRGHGLGERLVREAMRSAAELGCRSLWLETLPGLMDPAIELYRRLGFRPSSRLTESAVPGLTYLERSLDSGVY